VLAKGRRTKKKDTCLDELNVLSHSLVAIARAIWQGKLGALEPHLLGEIRPGSGAINRQTLFRFATKQLVNGLIDKKSLWLSRQSKSPSVTDIPHFGVCQEHPKWRDRQH
jgi:hypothetical protein